MRIVLSKRQNEHLATIIGVTAAAVFFAKLFIIDLVAAGGGRFTIGDWFLTALGSLGLALLFGGIGTMAVCSIRLLRILASLRDHRGYSVVVDHLMWSIAVVAGFTMVVLFALLR